MAERLNPRDSSWIIYGWEHIQRYKHALHYVSGKSVLDVGCGFGYGTYILGRNGAKQVVGVDISDETITTALSNYKIKNISFQQGDAENLTSRLGSFDVVTSFENIEHLKNPLKFISGAWEVLNENGLLLVSAPNTLKFLKAEKPLLNEFHLSEPSYEEFKKWVETKFIIEEEWEQSPVDFGVDRSHLNSLFLVRLERKIRRMLGMWNVEPKQTDTIWKTSEIFPLLPERRTSCQQFLFVCRRK